MGKKILKLIGIFLCAVLLAAIGYLAYVVIDYDRIDDCQMLVPQNRTEARAELGVTYTAVTQNIGFGAYTPSFTFFMDGGKQSWADSEESVKHCIDLGAETVSGFEPDIVLFQEVDTDSTRSYHINQLQMLTEHFPEASSVFAVNYHSAFLMYPLFEPHGASNSGILTLGRFDFTGSVRRSLPISTSFSKFLDLDRCYSVTRTPTDNGKELVIVNVHMSAYGGSDEIRTAQMTMLLNELQAEYDKGNYCVCGGDFNHDFTGRSTQDLNGGTDADFGWAKPFPDDLIPDGIVKCDNYAEDLKPTCRNCDLPYEEGNFTVVVDGFLVSENVEIVSVENHFTGFAYSDHCPVVLKFRLK